MAHPTREYQPITRLFVSPLLLYLLLTTNLAALRNLSSLYRKQGRTEAADILEKAAKGSRGDRSATQGMMILYSNKDS